MTWKTRSRDQGRRASRELPRRRRQGLAAVGVLDRPCLYQLQPARLHPNDDHAPADISDGQDFVLAVYDALASSPGWDRSLLVIVYDEHGGFYDHVPPPEAPDDNPEMFGRYGVRVPAIVVSPWVEPRSVSSTIFDHTSIIKSILLRFCPGPWRTRPTAGTAGKSPRGSPAVRRRKGRSRRPSRRAPDSHRAAAGAAAGLAGQGRRHQGSRAGQRRRPYPPARPWHSSQDRLAVGIPRRSRRAGQPRTSARHALTHAAVIVQLAGCGPCRCPGDQVRGRQRAGSARSRQRQRRPAGGAARLGPGGDPPQGH